MTPVFGIQACVDGMWCHVCADKQPLFFTDQSERDSKLRELSHVN